MAQIISFSLFTRQNSCAVSARMPYKAQSFLSSASTPIAMVTHFYDSSTDSVETQDVRLKPARAISDAHIPCLVWAEDALSFAHFVPTCLFALQLLVPTNMSMRRVPQLQQSFLTFKLGNPIKLGSNTGSSTTPTDLLPQYCPPFVD